MRKCFVFFFLVALLCSVSVSLFAQSAKPNAVPLLGDNSIEWQSDSNPSGQAEAFPVRAISSGSVASMAVFLDRVSTGQQVVVGLYADNNGHPGALLAQASTAQPNPGAWNTLPVTPTNVVQGTRYWIAVMGSGSGAIRFHDSNRGFCNSETSAQSGLTSLPPSWTTGGRWATCRVSAFGSGASAPVTVSVAVLPSAASLKGGKSQQFNANVSGTSNTSVAWKASGGTVASNGLFTAPMNPGSYVVTATSMADTTKSASAAGYGDGDNDGSHDFTRFGIAYDRRRTTVRSQYPCDVDRHVRHHLDERSVSGARGCWDVHGHCDQCGRFHPVGFGDGDGHCTPDRCCLCQARLGLAGHRRHAAVHGHGNGLEQHGRHLVRQWRLHFDVGSVHGSEHRRKLHRHRDQRWPIPPSRLRLR